MTIKKFGLTYTKEKNAETCSKVDHIHQLFPMKILINIIKFHVDVVNFGKKNNVQKKKEIRE
jgi:hypothetical protein